MDRVLVLGNGFLGSKYKENGFEVWGRDKFDIDLDNVADSVSFLFTEEMCSTYHTIINCIGCADTRKCEDTNYWNEVFAVNALVPKELSAQCKKHNMQFVQISTGCVYDRNDRPQDENDFIVSHCDYVVSKIAGENFCNGGDLILRPRLYFSGEESKNNLLSKLRNFDEFLLEINSYTSTQTIVESTIALLDNECVGVYNVANSGYTNLFEIARSIGLNPKGVLTAEELRDREGLYLVNNILDITSLEEYYKPIDVMEAIQSEWGKLNS